MNLGFTWSHTYARDLGLDSEIELGKILVNKKLEWVRLGCYWSEINPAENEWNWDEMDLLVNFVKDQKRKCILTIGMKTPRWPEYYIPAWIEKNPDEVEKKLMEFITECVNRYNGKVDIWQIGNEPLDPSGEKSRRILVDLLKKEIDIVKQIARNTPTMVTMWGNKWRGGIWEDVLKMENVDYLGIDWYLWQKSWFKWPFSGKETRGPNKDDQFWQNKIEELNDNRKTLIVSELQIEPWIEEILDKTNPKHVNWEMEKIDQALTWVKQFDPEIILLWGMEYWAWRGEKIILEPRG